MAKITEIKPAMPKLPTRKRVAAYARVSMETERLHHSLSAQVSYYSSLSQSNPEWIYAGVYADEGISGTSTEKRAEFQRMLADCEAGHIDIVLTKSISRFARNTVDLLNTVRHLRELGIEVRFEKENINSLSGDGEVMLTLLASFAQSESESISSNIKWAVQKRFQSGNYGAYAKHILGYRFNEELDRYVIIPEEAEIVRKIFSLYLSGTTLQGICDVLNSEGITTVAGNQFTEGSMVDIIKNEMYGGNILRQKTFVENPLTKKHRKNRGELPQYLVTEAHEAILDPETYKKVQEEIKRRSDIWRPSYPFCGMIVCGSCGMTYSRTKQISKGSHPQTHAAWYCRGRGDGKTGCHNSNFREDRLERITTWILGMDSFDADAFREQVQQIKVLPDGSLEYHLMNGETKLWKNLHLREYGYERTSTKAFNGKLICGKCGEVMRGRIASHGRYMWACCKRVNPTHSCDNGIYSDNDIRHIAAYILGLQEFDDAVFTERISTVVITGDHFEFHFTSGRITTWERM